MSYYTPSRGGAPRRSWSAVGGFGLSGTFPVQRESSGMLALQQELQRLGYLPEGSSVYGADGKFGPRTATALRNAARQVGWTDEPYTPPNAGEMGQGDVTVSDDLVALIRAAQPEADAPHAKPPSSSSPEVIFPEPDAAPARESDRGWVPSAVIGAAVVVVGGIIGYSMYAKKKKKKPKRNRRRRRRRTSRRR